MSVEENKALVRQIEAAWNSGRFDALDPLFASTCRFHTLLPGLPPGLAGAKQAHQAIRQAFPDCQMTLEDTIAEGAQIVARLYMTGTNHGGLPWLGISANARRVAIECLSLYRVEQGKIVAYQIQLDLLDLLHQLGVVFSVAASAGELQDLSDEELEQVSGGLDALGSNNHPHLWSQQD